MRKVSVWLAPTVVAATVLVLALGGVAQASRHVSPSVKKMSSNGITAVPSHRLLRTDFAGGSLGGAAAPAGVFTNVDAPQALNCPATKAPCTIEETMNVQYADGVANYFAECLLIDGSQFDNNGCAFAGPSTGSGTFVSPAQVQIATVGAGHHTVQTVVLPYFADTTLYNYTLAYRIYW